MTTRATTCARAKGVERRTQTYLCPGSKRPWKERHDLYVDDPDGWPMWGEVKGWDWNTILNEGGPYAVLAKAYKQAERAIAENEQDWPLRRIEARGHVAFVSMRPRPFSVLWPKGSRRDDQRLVMYELPGWGLAVITLAEFKQRIVDGRNEQEDAA